MEPRGNLELITDGGSRTVSYAIINEKIIITTNPASNKVTQIKANPNVTIDLTDKQYVARLIDGTPEAVALKTEFRAGLPMVGRFFNKIMGKNNTTIIELTEV